MSKMASETDHGEDCVNNKTIINEPPEFTTEEINELTNKEREAVPLQTPWTFWYDSSQHGANAEEFTKNLKLIYTVNTVQGFWAVFNNIAAPDELQPHYSYHFMQDERRPLWEDEVNQNGGTWKLKCSKHKTNKVWKELLLAAIGEQFVDCMAEGDKVCGVTVTVRDKDDLIQIWNVEAGLHTESTILNKISQLLPDVNFHSNFYKPHQTHHAYSGSARNYGQSGATRSLR